MCRLERAYGNQPSFATTAIVLKNGLENQNDQVKIYAISFFGQNRHFGNQTVASMSEVMFSFLKQAVQNMEKS